MKAIETLTQAAVKAKLFLPVIYRKKTDKKRTSELIVQQLAVSGSAAVVKKLYPDQALADMGKVLREWEAWFNTFSSPIEEGGWRVFLAQELPNFYKGCRDFNTRFWVARDAAAESLESYKDQAKALLGHMFDESDYSDADAFRRKFQARWEVQEVSSGNFLVKAMDDATAIALDIAREEQEKLAAARQSKIMDDVVECISEPVLHLLKMLDTPEKRYEESIVGNIKKAKDRAAKLKPLLNGRASMIDDVIKELEAKVLPHRAEDLKDEADTREKVKEDATAILKRLQGYI